MPTVSALPPARSTRPPAAVARGRPPWSWLAGAAALRVALALGRPGPALVRAQRLAAQRPGSRWAQATCSHLLAQAGRRDEALACARAAVAAAAASGVRAADAANAWFNLGYLLDQAGEVADAAEAFRQALRCQPRMDRAWYGLGLAALKTGALDEAEHALRQCTRLQPMAPPPWYQLARLLAEQGRDDEARAVIARLRRVEPRAAAQAARETGLEAAA